MKKAILGLVAASLLFASVPARAELKGAVIFKDTFYGALTGAIVGAAFMVFTDEPSDHLNYIAYGAAAGAIAGALFGAYESTSVAEYDLKSGNLYVALPTVRTVRSPDGFESSAEVFRMAF